MQSFLCTNCRREMCNDCREIAEEYQELLKIRTDALHIAEYTVVELKRQLESEKRRADLFEQTAKAGLPQVILAWMDKDISKLIPAQPDANLREE
jgi:hypothetical protein